MYWVNVETRKQKPAGWFERACSECGCWLALLALGLVRVLIVSASSSISNLSDWISSACAAKAAWKCLPYSSSRIFWLSSASLRSSAGFGEWSSVHTAASRSSTHTRTCHLRSSIELQLTGWDSGVCVCVVCVHVRKLNSIRVRAFNDDGYMRRGVFDFARFPKAERLHVCASTYKHANC